MNPMFYWERIIEFEEKKTKKQIEGEISFDWELLFIFHYYYYYYYYYNVYSGIGKLVEKEKM